MDVKDIEEEKEFLLKTFGEVIRSNFNSGILSENEVFSIELKDLQESFIEYFDTQNLHNVCVEELRNDQSKFKELVFTYDHKNVSFNGDQVEMFITSDKVELFEAANRKVFEGKYL